jgi:hypothetical protein
MKEGLFWSLMLSLFPNFQKIGEKCGLTREIRPVPVERYTMWLLAQCQTYAKLHLILPTLKPPMHGIGRLSGCFLAGNSVLAANQWLMDDCDRLTCGALLINKNSFSSNYFIFPD